MLPTPSTRVEQLSKAAVKERGDDVPSLPIGHCLIEPGVLSPDMVEGSDDVVPESHIVGALPSFSK